MGYTTFWHTIIEAKSKKELNDKWKKVLEKYEKKVYQKMKKYIKDKDEDEELIKFFQNCVDKKQIPQDYKAYWGGPLGFANASGQYKITKVNAIPVNLQTALHFIENNHEEWEDPGIAIEYRKNKYIIGGFVDF